jgi:hypothetical protein
MNVEFDIDKNARQKIPNRQKRSYISSLIILCSGGKVSTQREVNRVLIIGCVALIFISIAISMSGTDEQANFNPNIDPATGDYLPGEI